MIGRRHAEQTEALYSKIVQGCSACQEMIVITINLATCDSLYQGEPGKWILVATRASGPWWSVLALAAACMSPPCAPQASRSLDWSALARIVLPARRLRL